MPGANQGNGSWGRERDAEPELPQSNQNLSALLRLPGGLWKGS